MDWDTFVPGLLATTVGVLLALGGQALYSEKRARHRRHSLRTLLLRNIKKLRNDAEGWSKRKKWWGSLLEKFDTTTLEVAARDHYYVADNLDLLEKIDELRIHLEGIDRYYFRPVIKITPSKDEREFMNNRDEKLPGELEKAVILADAVIPLLESAKDGGMKIDFDDS
ncbi:MAG: hypothetical protein Q8Q11_03215 [bacterium]|nr:hypothetical protein [bacterium]